MRDDERRVRPQFLIWGAVLALLMIGGLVATYMLFGFGPPPIAR